MTEGKRIAILIGSSRFPDEPGLQTLRCPENDVEGLNEILGSSEHGAFDQTIVLKNKSHNEILNNINRVFKQATQNDQVLIYFSGHGKTDDPGRLYLTTADTQIDILESTSIPVENIRIYIENSKCRKTALILDCCYSGAVGKSFVRGDVEEQLKLMSRGSGLYILTASTAFQTAQEREDDQNGLLTKHLLDGIREGKADADDDGLISIEDLYQYVRRQVAVEGAQEPMRWAINVRGEELIIARTNKSPGREKQRLLREKVIEIRDSLPPQIFTKALQAVQDRRAPFYDRVDELYRRRLSIGEFIEEWYQIEAAERSQQPPPSIPPPQPQPEKPAKIEIAPKQSPPETSPPQPRSQPKVQPRPHPPPTTVTSLSDRQPQSASPPRSFAGRIPRKFIVGGLATGVALIALFSWLALNKTNSPETTKSLVSNPEATTPPVSRDSGLALRSSNFETVTLDVIGKETSRRTLQAEYFTEDLDGIPLEMVRIPGEEFQMGSPDNEANRYADEGPQHKVSVQEFLIGRFELTREQWRQVARMPRVKIDLKEDPSNFKDSWRQPVELVSWAEAVEFCARLQKKYGKSYRLPSEAEWEYAARARTATPFAFGSTITPQVVNYHGSYPYGSAPKGVYRQKTIEVGSLKVANAFGLYDMHGNVGEWCEDVWHDSYGGKHGNPPADGSAWITGGEQGNRVLRGGSWYGDSGNCRSATRVRNGAGHRFNSVGFRVVVAARTR